MASNAGPTMQEAADLKRLGWTLQDEAPRPPRLSEDEVLPVGEGLSYLEIDLYDASHTQPKHLLE